LLPAWQGEGGHIFCQPTVSGRILGLFIIDTATEGILLDPDTLPADLAAACERVAEHTVPGLGATPRTTALLRGLGPLILGPLMLERPVFREACLLGAVRLPSTSDPAPRLAGVLGYDFLRHCRLEIGTPPTGPWLRIRRPGGLAPPRQAIGWQHLVFLQRVPHLWVDLSSKSSALSETDATPAAADPITAGHQRGLFRLALGTGGAGVILGHRMTRRLGIDNPLGTLLHPSGSITAPASGGQPMGRTQPLGDGARTMPLARVGFPAAEFHNVLALCHADGDPDGPALHGTADGVLGAPLFRNATIVLDYACRRISISPLS